MIIFTVLIKGAFGDIGRIGRVGRRPAGGLLQPVSVLVGRDGLGSTSTCICPSEVPGV